MDQSYIDPASTGADYELEVPPQARKINPDTRYLGNTVTEPEVEKEGGLPS